MRSLTDDMDDAKYVHELFDHVRSYLTLEETLELVAGNDVWVNETGIEALEQWSIHGIEQSIQQQMEYGHSSLMQKYAEMIQELPDPLMEQAFWSQIHRLQSGFTTDQSQMWDEIELLQEGEDVFDVDFTEEILEVAVHLDESESKVDLLEERGEISSDEWYERNAALADD